MHHAIDVLRNEINHAFLDRRYWSDQRLVRDFIRSCILAVRLLEAGEDNVTVSMEGEFVLPKEKPGSTQDTC